MSEPPVYYGKEKLFLVEVTEPWQREYLKRELEGQAHLVFLEGTVQGHVRELREATLLSTFINSRLGREEFESLPGLRYVATRSTGYDHIDVLAAGSRNVLVANVPTYGENTVAEHTFALILSLSRLLRKAYFRTRDGNFSLTGLMGFDLKGKTIGVVGTGHIGLHVIRMAKGFGLEVLAYDVKQDSFLAEVLDYRYVALDELLGAADVITLHVPLLPSTHHLIHAANIRKIKKGAILVNTSRGALVETAALVQALDEGILSGAGLDVLEGEELLLEEKRLLETAENEKAWEKLRLTLKNHILLQRDNVIYTPHMAFYSREAVTRILDTTIHNIRTYLQGSPENIVNRQDPAVRQAEGRHG